MISAYGLLNRRVWWRWWMPALCVTSSNQRWFCEAAIASALKVEAPDFSLGSGPFRVRVKREKTLVGFSRGAAIASALKVEAPDFSLGSVLFRARVKREKALVGF